MKIMLLASSQVSIPPEKGGAIEAILYELANFLSPRNEVYVISRRPYKDRRIKYINVDSRIRKNKLASLIEDVFYGLRCLGQVRKLKPDILHMNTTFTSLPLAFFKRFLPKETKIVYTSHSPAWTVPDSEIGRINKLFNRIEAFSMRRADVVTAVSNSMRDGIVNKANMDEKKTITIPNFSRPDEFSPKYGKKWRIAKKITGSIVLFVGKLTYTKGVDYLIRSIPMVLKKYPNTKFVFVGGIEHEQNLNSNPWYAMTKELGVEKNVIFLGSVSKEELPKIYASADVFALPTLREGMPMVLLEAMSSGLPVVTTKISGIPEIIDEKAALFVRRKDSNDLADNLVKILSDPRKAKKMGKESRKAAYNLRKDVILERYEHLYASL